MPRSSRHKSSSKHSSSTTAREYSDSEKEKEKERDRDSRKGREEGGGGGGSSSRVGKESASGEKRKIDSKSIDALSRSGDEYVGSSSSKKRKEKVEDDRWAGGEDETGGENNVKREGHLKSKSSLSSRREGDSGFEGEEGKRSGGKSEGKHHHRSDRSKDKSDKEGGSERDRKSKESGKVERLNDGEARGDDASGEGKRKVELEEERARKPVVGDMASNAQDEIRKSEHGKEPEKRVRRKKDGTANEDKLQEGVRDGDDKQMYSRDDSSGMRKYNDEVLRDKYGDKDGRRQDEKQKDIEKDGRHQDAKQRDLDNDISRPDEQKRDFDKDIRRQDEKQRDFDKDIRRQDEKLRDFDKDIRRQDEKHRDFDKDGRHPDEKQRDFDKDGRYHDEKQREFDMDGRRQDEKQRDERHSRDHTGSRFEDKYSRNDKKELDMQQKKSKLHDGDRDQERTRHDHYHYERERERVDRDHDPDRDRRHDRDRDVSRGYDRSREFDRDRDRDRDKDRDQDLDHDRSRDLYPHESDRDRVHDRDRDRDQVRGRDRDRDQVRDRDHDRDQVRDRDLDRDRSRDQVRDRDNERVRDRGRDWDHNDHEYSTHLDNRSSRYKEDKRNRRSLEYYEDNRNDKSRGEKMDDYQYERSRSGKADGYHYDKSRNVKVEGDRDGERTPSRKGPLDNISGSKRGFSSPSSRTHDAVEKYRDVTREENKPGDSMRDAVSASGAHERASMYGPVDKRAKFDNYNLGDLPAERSPASKVLPMGLKERSPSSISVDHKFVNRADRRQSLDVDEAERRSTGSNDVRDSSVNEDRLSRDFSSKKSLAEEYVQVESQFYQRSSQGNASTHAIGPPGFRAGAASPFSGSMREEGRSHTPSRYRRSVDPNIARAQSSPWRGVGYAMPNGYPSFSPMPSGPPQGGFGAVMPQFPNPHMYPGVRPAMEGYPGMPYMTDADMFSGHMRPLGYLTDGSGPHVNVWDANNSVLRDASPVFRPGYLPNGRMRETNAEMWKQNGDSNMGVGPGSLKDEYKMKASVDEAFAKAESQESRGQNDIAENLGVSVNKASSDISFDEEAPTAPNKVNVEKSPESPAVDNIALYLHAYLSKLDISIELVQPELYNQLKSLESEKQLEDVHEDAMELSLSEEPVAAYFEFSDPSMEIAPFPAVEASIFQRALELYSVQSMKGSTTMGHQEKVHALLSLESGGEKQICFPEEGNEKKTHSSDQEILSRSVAAVDAEAQLVSTMADTEMEEGSQLLDVEVHENLSSKNIKLEAQSSVAENPEAPAPVIADEKMSDSLPSPAIVAVSNQPCPESPPRDGSVSDIDEGVKALLSKVDHNETSSCAEDQVGGMVSDSLISSDDSVKVCEAVMSDESESVVLMRIHPPAESTQ